MSAEPEKTLIHELVEALDGLLIAQAGISDDPKAAQILARSVLQKARAELCQK